MAWRNFGSVHYYRPEAIDGWLETNHPNLRKYYIQFQYDDAYHSPTSLKCQAVFNHTSWKTGSGTDFFYLCLLKNTVASDGTIKKTVKETRLLHHGGTTVKSDSNAQRVIPQTTSPFYLTKDYNDDFFYMPDFVIFCQGREGTLGKFSQSLYDGGRKNWKDSETGADYYYNGWTPPSYPSSSEGSISIIDTKRNGFYFNGSIPSTLPKNNPSYAYPNFVTKAWIDWELDKEVGTIKKGSITIRDNDKEPPSSYTYTTGAITLPIDIDLLDDNITVTAQLKCTGKYNNPTCPSTELTVPCYHQPEEFTNSPNISVYRDAEATNPALRPSPKSYLKLSWDFGEPGNDNSPISGCRVYFYTKKSGDDNWVSYGRYTPSTNVHYEDAWYFDQHTNAPNSSYTIQFGERDYTVHINHSTRKCYTVLPCKDFGLDKGDQCYMVIEPWHYHKLNTGADKWWINYDLSGDTTHKSSVTTIESAGVVSTMMEQDEWIEGQVYVYDGEWKEASGVYVNTSEDSSDWKESI